MASRLVWAYHAARHMARGKSRFLRTHTRYCRREMLTMEDASERVAAGLRSGRPYMAGRLGLFETAVMRMYRFGIRSKYALVMDNLYNCAGFFPNDVSLGHRFLKTQTSALEVADLLASNHQFLEDYFINRCMPRNAAVAEDFGVYEAYRLQRPWSAALAGRKVLVVTPFTQSVEAQYARRERIYPGTDILPAFDLRTYRSLLTVGDMRDPRFADWFEALAFMEQEILAQDFDVALLGCGAYGLPLAAAIRRAGRQAVHMGGVLQILFGILGRRWDGSRFGGPEHMDPRLSRYVSDAWIYPLEGRPEAADRVEYGPYWG